MEVSYGPRALDLLERGADPQQALAQLVAEDPGSAGRQVAIVDAHGRVATHTGGNCIGYAGHATGDGVSCQANIMVSESIWPAMLAAYSSTGGSLTERLLAALEAAEREGGDARGRQSAAILIVAAEGEAWQTLVSLRVEDHADPLPELRRLTELNRAYGLASRADEYANDGRHQEAATLYREASELAPDNHELRFWAGLGAAQGGDLETAVRYVREAIEHQPRWREVLGRLPATIAPSAGAVLVALDE